MDTENDELLKSMLTGMDGTSMEPFEAFGVEEERVEEGGRNDQINLDEFNLELLSPTSSSSDGSSSMADIGYSSQNSILETANVLSANIENSELDLIDYLSNGKLFSFYMERFRSFIFASILTIVRCIKYYIIF